MAVRTHACSRCHVDCHPHGIRPAPDGEPRVFGIMMDGPYIDPDTFAGSIDSIGIVYREDPPDAFSVLTIGSQGDCDGVDLSATRWHPFGSGRHISRNGVTGELWVWEMEGFDLDGAGFVSTSTDDDVLVAACGLVPSGSYWSVVPYDAPLATRYFVFVAVMPQ